MACRARGTGTGKAAQKQPGKETAQTEVEQTPLRPAQCRSYMRRVLAREFRGIVDGFVKEAKSGSCQHVKLATELVTPPSRPRRPRGPGSLKRVLEVMERGYE